MRQSNQSPRAPSYGSNSSPLVGLGVGPAPPPRKTLLATNTNPEISLQSGPLRSNFNPHRRSAGRNDSLPSNPSGRGNLDEAAVAAVPPSNVVFTRPLPNLNSNPNLTNNLNLTRKPIRIATWNVLTLNSPGHSTLLSAELSRLRISIAGLQEVRWPGSGETNAGDYRLLWSGHDSDRVQGVALALDKTSLSALVSWQPLGPRLLYARLKHSQGFLSIFVCYAPTDTSEDTLKDSFYETLHYNLQRVSSHDIVTVLGDMNATVGPTRDGVEHIVDPFTSTNTNDNGERMTELSASHNLKIASTWFQHRRIHTTSWYSNTGITSKTIDHILISGRWRTLSDCRVFRSAELGSTDHRLVAAKLHLHLKRSPTASPHKQQAVQR